MNHTVGDIVTIRSWESMAEEYGDFSRLCGYDPERDIKINCKSKIIFASGMAKMCGKSFEIMYADENYYKLAGGDGWSFVDEMFEDFHVGSFSDEENFEINETDFSFFIFHEIVHRVGSLT